MLSVLCAFELLVHENIESCSAFHSVGLSLLGETCRRSHVCASVPSLPLVEKNHRQEGIHREVCMGSHLSACIGLSFLVV